MKIDLRILGIVACLTVIAASTVVFVRYAEMESRSLVIEKIGPKGVSTAEQIPKGMLLQVHSRGLSLAFPSCDTREYGDKFFLHIYPDGDGQKSPTDYINLDFDWTEEKGREVGFGGSKVCVVDKSFPNVSIKQVAVGQFTTPGGKCCDITWSRSFLLNANLPRK